MAVATGTLSRKQQRLEAKAAAKEKRNKVVLIGGSVLLVGVLAFELPKVLGGSSSTPAPAPAVAIAPAGAPTSPAVLGAPSPALVARQLKTISHLSLKDPFTPQLSAGGGPSSSSAPFGKGPAVRASHFKLKDPFKAQLAAEAPSTATAPLAQPTHSVTPVPKSKPVPAAAPYGYIVILRSVDTKAGGLSEVKKAHAAGLASAGLLYSSAYTTLRHGYWVVYLAKYRTWDAANAGLDEAKAHGYASAYRRPARK